MNADILPGGISDAITLNRYAYANGNPVSFVDLFGLKGLPVISDYVRDAAEYPYRFIAHGVLDLPPYYLTLNSNTREQYEDKVVDLTNSIIEYSKNPMALGEDIFSYFVDQLDHFVSKPG